MPKLLFSNQPAILKAPVWSTDQRVLITVFVLIILLSNTYISKAQTLTPADTSVAILDEVVVTGQITSQTLRNSVYKIKTINAERIKMRAATDVIGVLNSELGIRFSTDNTLRESDTKILGMGGSRVKILIDGVPMVDRDATR